MRRDWWKRDEPVMISGFGAMEMIRQGKGLKIGDSECLSSGEQSQSSPSNVRAAWNGLLKEIRLEIARNIGKVRQRIATLTRTPWSGR